MGNKPSYFAKTPENVARVFLTGREHQEGFPWPPLPALEAGGRRLHGAQGGPLGEAEELWLKVCRGRNGPWVRTNFVSAVFGFAILAIAVQQILPSGLGGHIKIEGGVMQRVPWFLVIMLPPLFGFFGASMAASKAMKAFGPAATRILQTQSGSTSLVVKSYSHWLQKGQTEGPQGWEGNCTEPRIYWLDFEDSSAAPRASGQLAAGAPMPGYPGGPIARPAAAPAAAPKAETAPPVPQPAFGGEHQEATFGGDGATFGGGSTTFGGGATFGSSDLFEKK